MVRELLGLVTLGLLLYSAMGWGKGVLGWFRWEFRSRAESFVMSTLVGFGVIAFALLAFGLAGLFYPALLWAVLLAGGIFALMRGVNPFHSGTLSESWEQWKKLDHYTRALVVLCVVILVITVLKLRLPPTTADELSYHLSLPKTFLLKHSVFYWPYHVNSVFPLLTELLYTYGVMLSSAAAFKGIHFIFGILIGVSIYGMAREFFPGLRASWPVALFFAIPIVNHQMALANNDLALTAFLVGAYWALFRWTEKKESRWLGLAGALSGLAMGVKYLALFAVAVQLLLILTESVRSQSGFRKTAVSLFLFSVFILIVGAVWYARSYFHTGNPIHPYLTSFFGGHGVENPLQLEGKGFGKDWKALLLLPWNATFHPEVFGGVSNQWGPIFLAFLPWSLWVPPKERGWWNSCFVAGLTFLLWFYSKQNLRFLLPALPFFSLIVVKTFEALRRKGEGVRWAANCFFLLFMGLYMAIPVYQLREAYPLIFGRESEEHYLSKRVGSFEVARFLNEEGKGKRIKILSQDQWAYFFDGEVVREKTYRMLSKYDTTFQGREREFYETLLNEDFTHLLIVEKDGAQEVALLDRLVKLQTQGKEKGPQLIQTRSFQSPEGTGMRSYSLYELNPLSDVPQTA
jgi:hypothetical protein